MLGRRLCQCVHCYGRTGLLWLQVVVDAIDPSVIVSQCASKTFDFGSITDPELINFTIPLQLQIGIPSKQAQGCAFHGRMKLIAGIKQRTAGTVCLIICGSVACAVRARLLTSPLSLSALVCIEHKKESAATCDYPQPSAAAHRCVKGQQRPAATVLVSSRNINFSPVQETTSSK